MSPDIAALASFKLNADATWMLDLVRENLSQFGSLLDRIYSDCGDTQEGADAATGLIFEEIKAAAWRRSLGAAFKASMLVDTLPAEQLAPLMFNVVGLAMPYSERSVFAAMTPAGRA